MGYYTRRRSSAFSAAHNALAQAATASLPADPPADLVARRVIQCPHSTPFQGLDSRSDAVVLDVPFGKRGSIEIRQWVKHIGGRWDKATKQWTLSRAKCTPDAIRIINELRLYTGKTIAAPAEAFVPRVGAPGTRIILKVPYEDRQTAKAAGAHWNTVGYYWYLVVPATSDPNFSEQVTNFESKGWVDVPATEREIIKTLNTLWGSESPYKTPAELKFAVPVDRTAARRTLFANPAPVKPVQTKWSVTEGEQNFLDSIVNIHRSRSASSTQPVATMYSLWSQTDPAMFRIILVEGHDTVRITRSADGDRTHFHLSKEDARRFWGALTKSGFGLRSDSTATMTAGQLAVWVGKGQFKTHSDVQSDPAVLRDALLLIGKRWAGTVERVP